MEDKKLNRKITINMIFTSKSYPRGLGKKKACNITTMHEIQNVPP
jgi:hypothetical protein